MTRSPEAPIRPAQSDSDLALAISIQEATDAFTATTVDDMRSFLGQAEAPLVLLAGDVGFGRVMLFPGERDATLGGAVLSEARGRGIGGQLLTALEAHAVAQGWPSLLTAASNEDAIAWLERRGFEAVDRQERVVLELAAAPDVEPQLDPSLRLTDLATHPQLLRPLHELLVAGLEDVPGDLAGDVPDLEAFRRLLEPPSRRRDFIVLALDGDRLVGMAGLNVYPRVGYHGFTTVARSHRGRGVARALKLELIRRAKAIGLERLLTQSNVDNTAMRTLNAELGYTPAPASVFLRRRLAAVASGGGSHR